MDAQQDNRAMPVRFFLNTLGETPLSVEQYGEAQTLYFLVPNNKKPEALTSWEYTVFGKSKVVSQIALNSQYNLYRFERVK
jgi:hypothetical protein